MTIVNNSQGQDDQGANQDQKGQKNDSQIKKGDGKGEDQGKSSADSQKSDNNQDQNTLSDDQWKIAYQSPRFKELNEKAKKADELQAKILEDENKKLEDQKKYQELSEKLKKENEDFKGKFVTSQKIQAIVKVARELKFRDPDMVVKLIDIDSFKINDAGEVEGIEDALKKLATEKPFLVGEGQQSTIGAPIAPSGDNPDTQTYKLSEIKEKLKDREWYLKNKDWVEKAFREKRIIDDVHVMHR